MIDKDFLTPQITDAETWFLDNDIQERECLIILDNTQYLAKIIHIIDCGGSTMIGFTKVGSNNSCIIYAPMNKTKIIFNL